MFVKFMKEMLPFAVLAFIMAMMAHACTSALNAAPADFDRLTIIKDKVVRIDHPIDERSLDRANEIYNLAQTNTRMIDIILTSPGGYVHLGEIIIQAMEQAKGQGKIIRCIVPSFAASMAANILLNCDQRFALPDAKILFHEAAVGGVQGRLTATVALALAQHLYQIDAPIITKLSEVTGISLFPLTQLYIEGEWHTATKWKKMSNNNWISTVNTIDGIDNLFKFSIETENARLQKSLNNGEGTLTP